MITVKEISSFQFSKSLRNKNTTVNHIDHVTSMWNSFLSSCHSDFREGWSGGNMGLRPLGPKEIYGEPVPPGKAYRLLTDHLATGKPLWFEPAQQKVFKSNHLYK